MDEVVKGCQKKRTHKLTPSERAQVLEKAPVVGVSEVARQFGVTPGAVSHLLSRRDEAFTEAIAEREGKAIRHGLDDKDAMVTAMVQMADAVLNNFRTKAPDGTPVPDAPMVINGQHSAVLRDVSDTLMKAAKLRGWDVTKTQNEHTGEIVVNLTL